MAYLVGKAELLACTLHKQQRGDLTNAPFDGSKADELAVELLENCTDTGLGEFSLQVDACSRLARTSCITS